MTNALHFKLPAITRRISRKLDGLVPRHVLKWDYHAMNYYVHTIPETPEEGSRVYGPYYWCHLPALARHINALDVHERHRQIVIQTDRSGDHAEEALPRALKFIVVTKVLQDAINALRGQGFEITPPPTITDEPVPPTARDRRNRPPAHSVIDPATGTYSVLPVLAYKPKGVTGTVAVPEGETVASEPLPQPQAHIERPDAPEEIMEELFADALGSDATDEEIDEYIQREMLDGKG